MLFASFYEASGLFDSSFNRLAAKLSGGKFCHSDFIFKWNKDELTEILSKVRGLSDIRERASEYVKDGFLYVCVHVYWGGSVSYRVLMPDHVHLYWRVPDTEMRQLSCTWEEELQIFQWCMRELGKSYDYFGALTYLFRSTYGYPCTYGKYYCSMFMVKALQEIGKLEHINCRAIVPNHLYRLLYNLSV